VLDLCNEITIDLEKATVVNSEQSIEAKTLHLKKGRRLVVLKPPSDDIEMLVRPFEFIESLTILEPRSFKFKSQDFSSLKNLQTISIEAGNNNQN